MKDTIRHAINDALTKYEDDEELCTMLALTLVDYEQYWGDFLIASIDMRKVQWQEPEQIRQTLVEVYKRIKPKPELMQ